MGGEGLNWSIGRAAPTICDLVALRLLATLGTLPRYNLLHDNMIRQLARLTLGSSAGAAAAGASQGHARYQGPGQKNVLTKEAKVK